MLENNDKDLYYNITNKEIKEYLKFKEQLKFHLMFAISSD